MSHYYEILAISAQWVDRDYKPQKALLAMPEYYYSHNGEIQASLIINILAKYSIAPKLGYHIKDNVILNNTCLSSLSR